MNIAIITTHPIQYQAPLFRAIAGEQHIELTVFFGSDHGVDPSKIDPGFGKAFSWDVPLLDGYRHVFLKNSHPGISVNDWRLDGPALKSYLTSENFDAIVIFGWNKMLFWQAMWWGRKNGIPLILRGESNLKQARNRLVKSTKEVLFPLLFKQFKSFLAIGTLNAGLYKHFGVPDEAIFIAPYCVDNDYFKEQSTAQKINARQLRAELSIPYGDTVFLFMAKFIDRKRPLDVIAAAAGLRKACDNHVILVGDGPLMADCRQAIKEYGLSNVHVFGFKNQGQLPMFYAAADVLVLSSEYETWGLVINEAMACGLPCIVSDSCGAAADLIIEGETGFIYPVGSVDQLERCMKHMTQDSKNRQEMGFRAAKHVENFSVGRTVAALKDALHYAVNR